MSGCRLITKFDRVFCYHACLMFTMAAKPSLAYPDPAEDRVAQVRKIRRFWLSALALFLLTVIVYIPSMSNGFIWDDPAYVVNNQTLNSADGLWRIWTELRATPQYYPMVHTTFWIEAHLWGTNSAPGFHVDNILLHALAVILLWRALAALAIPWPWLAAAIFAVHPVMVESVAWVTERKNVLSIVFYLLAFHAYRRSGLLETRAPLVGNRSLFHRHWYLASLVLFLLALFSKTVTCSLPAAILLVLWWKRNRITWNCIKPLLPMFVMGLILSSITSNLEATNVGASGPDFRWSPIDRCIIAGHAIFFYAIKMAWPHPLMFMYPRWDLHSDLTVQLVYPMIVIGLVGGLWLARKRIGRGPLVAVLFFIGTLTPALGFVNVYPMRYSFVADHFQYLASIGLIALAAAGLQWLGRWLPHSLIWVCVLAPLAILTWREQSIYKNAHDLWQNTIDQNETCWMAHVNMASVYSAEKNNLAAFRESQRAYQLAPNEADTNYDMAVALGKQAKWSEAADMLRRATQCDPTCAQAWSLLARVLWEHFDTPAAQAEAVNAASTALIARPGTDPAEAHYVLGRAAEYGGNDLSAVAEFQKALTLDPNDSRSQYHAGVCLLRLKQPELAAGQLLKVLAHDPNDSGALTYLGNAYLQLGKVHDAVQSYQKALRIAPTLVPAQEGLKNALRQDHP
jgi:tetratricopeptide (TPR) repeat protein